MNTHATQLEAILFFKGEPLSFSEIAHLLNISENNVQTAGQELKEHLARENRGIRLMENNGAYMLATAPEMAPRIEKLIKDELERDLGKAGLETLSIVLYYGPITRARIDHIRGVNSSFTVRQLAIRGLIEREENPNDQRSYLYKPTFELLSYLGVTNVSELPEYTHTKEELENFSASPDSDETHE
ncbi:MAG: SMC-Scp complex subunit ScpB [Candidatus Campbellbacteria bacterium]|nr:SMC-Scp complex subunit ScpB [Candidatus Campbellbacteria bacterium]